MKKTSFRSAVLITLFMAAVLWSGGSAYPQNEGGNPNGLGGMREFLGSAIAVQKRQTDRLLSIPEVVGTAVGLTADGQPAIKVYAKAETKNVPLSLEDFPVEVEVTGEFRALAPSGTPNPNAANGGIDPTSRFSRPVPIGVSTGNEGECSAGTISARLTDGTSVYALSNNHVYALENHAAISSRVLQPGLFDTNCAFSGSNVIGTLTVFQPIVFQSTATNTIDAAVALSSTADLGNATPSNGYGMPDSATVTAFVGQAVQKYGRTTGLTKGRVTGINATILVGYGSGTARFVDQIVVGSNKPFIKAGDSGSLLVTNPSANPVGLLFAGTSSGKTAIANRIDLVLQGLSARAGVSLSIDGQ